MAGAALLMAMGTGKTRVAMGVIRNLEVQRILVLCPRAVLTSHVWRKEAEKHCPGTFIITEATPDPGWRLADRISYLGTHLQRARRAEKPCIAVINYECLDNDEVVDMLIKQNYDMLVMDESHKLKAPTGKRSGAALKLARKIEHRLAMTGTLMPHSPLDVFAQYRILDSGIFGTSVTQFKSRWAVTGGLFNQIVHWKDQNEMHRRIYSIAYRVGDEVLDLPPERHDDVDIKLCAKAMSYYRDIEQEMVAKIGDGTLTINNALVQILRLQQCTSGFLPSFSMVDDTRYLNRVDYGKQEALEEILDELQPPIDEDGHITPGEPLVVFAKFKHDLDAVKDAAKKYGFRYGELSGRMDNLDAWKAGDYDVLGVQIQCGGSGIDLTRARYCVYYSVGHSLGDYLQSVKRVHRPGQMHPTTFYHLVCEGTIDREIYNALQDKKDVVDAILDMMKHGRRVEETYEDSTRRGIRIVKSEEL